MYQSILDFWFTQTQPVQRWKVDSAFDQLIAKQFSLIHQQAIQSELFQW